MTYKSKRALEEKYDISASQGGGVMKFWEWWIFTTGILCVLSADSSIGWCAVLAIACLFGIIMRQFVDDVIADTRRSMATKRTGSTATESDAWIGRCNNPEPTEAPTVWELWQ